MVTVATNVQLQRCVHMTKSQNAPSSGTETGYVTKLLAFGEGSVVQSIHSEYSTYSQLIGNVLFTNTRHLTVSWADHILFLSSQYFTLSLSSNTLSPSTDSEAHRHVLI